MTTAVSRVVVAPLRALEAVQPESAIAPPQQDVSIVHGIRLDSAALLQGQKVVQIAHNDCVYRLQLTKQGKLILTK